MDDEQPRTRAHDVVTTEAGGRWRYEITGHSSAQRETVWRLVAEVEQWERWSMLSRTFLLRPGAPEPNGVGALRRLGVGRVGSTEEVVAFEPPRHLGYEARKGMPARHYRADVVLEDDEPGTTIRWAGALEPLVPGTGRLALAYARGFVSMFLKSLVRFADAHPEG
ncbi:MAG TPA: SRPBCC family protein [Acidimicrobiales bacterium]|nr:SRPBCC family protein [Acidimicrobiales bacterium]